MNYSLLFARGTLAALMLLTPAALLADADAPAPQRVLLLHQAGGSATFRGRFDVAFVDAMRSGDPSSIDLFEESIDARFPGAEQSRITRTYLENKYRGRSIDVIVSTGINPFTFAKENRTMFGNPPIVAIVAPAGALTSANVTGLQGGGWIDGTIRLALALRPSTDRVYVVDGARENGSPAQSEFQRQLAQNFPNLELVYLRDLPLSDVVSRVSTAPERSIVFFVRQSMRSQTQDVDEFAALAQIVRASPVPVFSHLDQYLGHGIVGGSIWQFELDARRLAQMAKQIAVGASVSSIRSEPATYAAMLDWNQLQRWGIPESRIPTGTEILFRKLSFFERYRLYVLGGLALVLAQAILIATLWIQRARRRDIEARNMAILRAAPDVMFLQDRDGVYLDYHAPGKNCLFVPPERFIGYKMTDVLSPPVLALVKPLFEQALKTDETVISEYELDLPEGKHRYEARLVRCGEDKVLSVVRDITERTAAQAALIQSEERYAMATAAGGSGVWDWNLDTKELYVDPRLKAVLGFENEQMPARSEEWARRIHPDDVEMVLSRARAHIRGELPSFEAEFRMPHKDGSIRWILGRGSVIREKGQPARLVGTYTDLTDRKQGEQALRQAQSDLDRMSRLAAFGEFTASIAHEVSQPLTAIIINTRACLRWLAGGDSNDLDEVRNTLSEVIEAGKRADGIIRRNRELFRRHIVKNQRLDLNDVVREVVLLSGERLNANHVRLETRLARRLPELLGDRVELCQLFVNLISNSVDAMADVDEAARVITITTKLALQDSVEVCVRDSGVGLDRVDIGRMFTTGYTTKPTGTGVGLSICRTIVEAHRGRIWATRNEGSGATIHVSIPVHAPTADDLRHPPSEMHEATVAPGMMLPGPPQPQ